MSERLTQLSQAVAAVQAHPHAAKLAEATAAIATRMSETRSRHAAAADVEQVLKRLDLERDAAQTDFGNVLSILERGAEDPAERAIVSAFVAEGAIAEVVSMPSAASAWAERLCTLGAHAGFSPLGAITSVPPSSGQGGPSEADAARGAVLRSIVDFARAIEQGRLPTAGRAELLIAAAGLAEGLEARPRDDEFAQMVSRLSADLSDPLAARLITARAADAPSTIVQTGPSSAAVHGQLSPYPRSAATTVVMGLTGWLVLRSLALLALDHVLGLDRKARIELTEQGLSVRGKIALLGRELRDYSSLYPLDAVSVLTREVRYPALPVYAGLIALLAGTYAGVTFVAWGYQAGSPRLLAYGLLALLAGVALDLALTSLIPGVRGEVRLLLVPKRGRRLSIAGVEREQADRLLADVASRLRRPTTTNSERVDSRSSL